MSAAATSLAAAASCAPSGSGPAVESVASAVVDHQVEIKGFAFVPERLDVKVGDTVTFTNLDIVPHTATANDKSWDTGNLDQNESATITITADMMADYFCLFHPNMVAALQVT